MKHLHNQLLVLPLYSRTIVVEYGVVTHLNLILGLMDKAYIKHRFYTLMLHLMVTHLYQLNANGLELRETALIKFLKSQVMFTNSMQKILAVKSK